MLKDVGVGAWKSSASRRNWKHVQCDLIVEKQEGSKQIGIKARCKI